MRNRYHADARALTDLLALYDVNAQITAIEELIAQGADMRTVLRLLCLASIILGGDKAKSLENIKREVLQVGSVPGITAFASLISGNRHMAITTCPCFYLSQPRL